MTTADRTSHRLDRPANRRLLWRGLVLLAVLSVAAEWLIELHPHFELESWFGFNAWYGFLACAAMVGMARLLALWLARNDRYYRTDDPSGREQGDD
ncbi:hypothetical protein [Pseudomarimonas arenosa]|uniref:Solute:sodium symporter small subunit n=1 Tax=Pseudomarimonas arenosa TaxID=2774145 RepID=A0AAW3ZGI4_9GAMM|nr:hypothetical protein [Pseudomarimonas arenosa]MBD8525148.1 hypothetical protein [Pseudomarimonas arenosa]